MNRLKFKEFITLQRGHDLPKSQMVEGEFPVVGSTSVLGFHNEYKRNPPGVVTGRSGSLGTVQYIRCKYWPHNTSLWVKDFKGNLPRYVYYLLKTLPLASYNAGAGVPTLNRNHLDNLDIRTHDLPEQRKISAILAAYDDLIENNTRRIQILEEMAQRIYREWFVDFRFPGHEKVKFVDSTMRKIPEEAKVVKFGGLIEIKKGKKSIEVFVSPNINTVPYLLIDFFDGMHSSYVNKEKTVLVEDDEVLMVMDGARSGLISLSEHGAIGSTIACLRSKKSSPFYLYHFLKFNEDIIRSKNTGAAIPHANKDFMNLMDIIMFPDRVLEEFVRTVKPIHHLKRKLRYKTKNLRNTRDVLLPKLISGEIDVSEMAIAIREQDTKNGKASRI